MFKRIKAVFVALRWLPKVIVYFWRAVRWVQDQDAKGVKFLSDEFWARVRKAMEEFVLRLAKGQDKGIRGLFQSDNQLLKGCGICMKSDRIAEIYSAATPNQVRAAEARLSLKDPTRSVQAWERHGNHP